MILVRGSIPCKAINNPIDCGDNVEVQAVELTLLNRTLLIYNLYKHMLGTLDISELFASAEDNLMLIGGDFNAHHPILNSPRATNADGHHLASTLDESPFIGLLNTGEATHTQGGRLDLTLVSSSLLTNSSWGIHEELTSDHFAILTSLGISKITKPPPRLPRWNIKKADWLKYQRHLENWFNSYESSNELDQLELDFSTAISNAADQAIPMSKVPKINHKDKWFYCKVKEVNSRVNATRKLYRRSPTAENLQLLRAVV